MMSNLSVTIEDTFELVLNPIIPYKNYAKDSFTTSEGIHTHYNNRCVLW